jgi:hypothetical protein
MIKKELCFSEGRFEIKVLDKYPALHPGAKYEKQ